MNIDVIELMVWDVLSCMNSLQGDVLVVVLVVGGMFCSVKVSDYLLVNKYLEWVKIVINKMLDDFMLENVLSNKVIVQDMCIILEILCLQVFIVKDVGCDWLVMNFECVVELIVVLDDCIFEIYNVFCFYCLMKEELMVIVDDFENCYQVKICVVFVCEVVMLYVECKKFKGDD